MADNLGGLFDSDPGFLEELASGAEETGHAQPMQGMIPQQNIGMMPGVQQQRQSQPGYNMPANNFNNMQFANQQQPQQQQQAYGQPNYNQYTNQQGYTQNNIATSTHGQPQGHMMQKSTHQAQFSSPSGGMMQQQHQGQTMYPYSAAGANQARPSLPNQPQAQQQPMKVAQMQNWNQNQMFSQQQQQQQPQAPAQQQYMPHHDYPVSNATGQQPMQQMPQPQSQQYPTSQPQQNQAAFIQRLASPTRIKVSNQSTQPSMMAMQPQTIYQQSGVTGNQIQQQQQPQQFIQQGQQTATGQYQQFPYRSPPTAPAQGMGDKLANTSQQVRFPQTSPTQQNLGMQYNMNMNAVQRPANPMLSPRPTPPPQSPAGLLSPTGSTSSHQGNFNSVDPSAQVKQNSNMAMFQQSNNTETVINDLNQPSFSSSQTLTNQITSPPGNQANGNIAGAYHNGQSQVSPNFKVLSPNSDGSLQHVSAEVQALNQQIQHMYSLPQTPQNQQKLLDLQEKMRQVKAAQQQQQQMNQRSLKQQQPLAKTAKLQQLQPQQVQLVPQQMQHMQPQLQQGMAGQVQQQQVIQPAQQQQQQKTIIQQQHIQGQSGGTLTFQLQGAGGAKQTGIQPGSKIHLVPSTGTGPQKVFIIQNQQQQAGQTVVAGQQQGGAQTQTMVTSNSVQQHQPQTQHIIINSSTAGAKPQHILIQTQAGGGGGNTKGGDSSQQQEKANKIIAEAIAKAQKSGNTTLPRVLDPPELPSTLGDLEENDLVIAEETEKPKKKKKRSTPKKDKDKEGKGGTPKSSRKSKKERKEAAELAAAAIAAVVSQYDEEKDQEVDIEGISEADSPKKSKKKKRSDSERKGRSGTPKSSKRSKVPPATFLKVGKRKRNGSSDGSDVELKITPPPSPEDEFKRRSGRHSKRKKYLDDVDLNLSDDDLEPEGGAGGALKLDNPVEEEGMIVDKILGSRIRQRDPDDEEVDDVPVEEYFLKYKNYSYLHCEWKTEEEIKDKRIQSKIKRYKLKKLSQINYFVEEEEYFNSDYVEVDRVLEESFSRDPVTGEEVVHYLVKWRSSAYEESTWELQQDVDPEKVKLFKKWKEPPPMEDRKRKSRPKSDDWKSVESFHTYKNDNTLREYQQEGVNWLTFCWYKNNNCILADEMGLGKTIQSIAYLQEIFNYGIKGPFLVVVPLSTIANWQREFETWTDMNAITYHGTTPSRYMLQEYEMYYRDEEGNKIKSYYRFHALITTYELVLSDIDLLKSIEWRALVVDEAHRLKNKNCSLIKCLRIFNCEHKVLLSGTPLQNNVEELFSLLNFLEPSQFHSSDAFNSEFGELKTEEQVEKLKAILKPMMLRRLKEDVEKNLAAKEETIIEVELTNIQKKYYRAILEKNFSYLCKGSQAGNVPSLMNTMMELRKCCNHPYLINGAEDNIITEFRARHPDKESEHIQALIQSSGKFVLLDKLLPKLKQNGNRVLIFSQMIRVLDIIEDYLINKRYMYERLDGRIRGNLRQEAIDRYSKPDSDRFVFLICTKAGGLGINLTAADTVIIYDSDWNPQNDLQAQARCHRIGQKKFVKVYRLITRNSYEREMFDRASMKLGLDKAVLQSMSSDKLNPQNVQLSKKEVEELLKKGAYGALMEDDNAGDKFCEEDIDQILKGRTQVVQIESEGKGSTFSKASFSMTSNREDIDINDPEFWQKWAKKADMDIENLDTKELIVDEPRVRKKTTRYGNNDDLADISDLASDSNTDDENSKKGGKKGKRSRRGAADDDEDFGKETPTHKTKAAPPAPGGYTRSELFKVEKGLLHYGWGRWKDIIAHSRFKRPMDDKDVENVAKAILLYGLQFYKGDERIKEFIWDLIAHGSQAEGLKNHSGLSAPVPRGRKGKKAKDVESHFDANQEIEKAGIKIDPDIVLNKNAYKRHIQRHSNKVLLRVRTLYYLKHEVLGDVVEQIDQGMNIKDINVAAPMSDTEPPTHWWDDLADKSLLVGVYKHGYEKYNVMRQDPCLVFLGLCGPPDNAALAAEMKDEDDNENDDMDDTIINDEDESLPAPEGGMGTPKPMKAGMAGGAAPGEGEDGKLPFPTVSELNTRLRRIITNYQRDFKKQQVKQQQQAKKQQAKQQNQQTKRVEKREKLDAMFKEREARRKETMQKWTRREEMDFYRVVSTYGIEFDRVKGRYIWDKFRVMARLDKKTDEQLTEYFISFYHMCLRVCRKIKEEAYPPTPVYIEPITEERANRCIARIDLLSKIREEIIIHPRMEGRIKQCKASVDLPPWWKSGKHDRELLIGTAKHGLARTDYYVMSDEALCFLEDVKTYVRSLSSSPANLAFGKDIKKEKSESPVPDKAKEVKSEKSETSEDVKSVKTEDGEKSSPVKEEVKKEASSEDSGNVKDVKTEPVDEEDKSKADESDVKEEKMETEEDEVKKEKPDEAVEVKDEMEVDVEDVKKEIEAGDKKVNSDKESVKEESEVKKEEGVVKEEKDGEKSDVKSEGEKAESKEDPDEEVRMAMEGEESQQELLTGVSETLLTQWPKDRVVFHRLEQICYCVETGEWPFPSKMKNVHILGIDSNSNTPSRSQTPSGGARSGTPKPETKDDPKDGEKSKKKEKDFEVQMMEGDSSLKMTFHNKKNEKPRAAADSEAEKAAKIQAILAQSLAASQAAASSDDNSQQESIFSQVSWPSPWHPSPPFYMVAQGGAESPFLNGSHMSEEEMLMNRSLMEQSMMFSRGRRGRKRKAEKMAEIAMAEALARRQNARALAMLEPDSHVPLINLEDGSRLTGEEAPRKKDLEGWLDQNPGFMVDTRDMDEIEEGEIVQDYPERRKGRKPKFDPAFLEVEKLTGEENVSVVNRLTGKRITGAKAPPLRYLAEWLEQNPMWDVDPKWADLVRAKGTLPKTLLPRVVTPSRRGRRPRDSPLSHSMSSGMTDPHQAAALAASLEVMNAANLMAAGYGKLPMPFGSIPGLGMNPMLGLSGFPGFPGMGSPIHGEKSETQNKDPTKCSKEELEKMQEEAKASGSGSHPFSPFMFNPLMYNPALMAAQGLNLQLPTSLSSPSSSLINGHPQSDEELSKSKSKSRHKDRHNPEQAEDLSVKTKKTKTKVIENTTEAHAAVKSKSDMPSDGEEMPCDLSMKPKGKEDKSKQKICSSNKLTRIVDTLKFRVNKMDEIPSKSGHDEKEPRRGSVDSMLADKPPPSPPSTREQPEISKRELMNSLSQKITSHASLSPNHTTASTSKEPLPKIVEELLAAKHQREKEELLLKQQKKLDSLMLKKEKYMLMEAAAKRRMAAAEEGGREESGEEEEAGQSSPEKS